jgi:hypothetical protein
MSSPLEVIVRSIASILYETLRRLRGQGLTWLLAEQAGGPALDLTAHTYHAAHGPAACRALAGFCNPFMEAHQ